MRVIGHRGACGYAPENTLASFELALALQVDEIELDAHALETGEVVVIHDFKVDATTNGTGYVTDYEFGNLRQLDAGDGQPIPLLTEVLDLIDGEVSVDIELKGRNTAKSVAAIIDRYLQEGWTNDHFRVTSENLMELEIFQDILPDIRTGVVYPPARAEHFLNDARQQHTNAAILNAAYVSEVDVRMAHQQGLEVHVYTVNDASEAERLAAMGVDAIFSNYPDIVRGYIGQSALHQPGKQRFMRNPLTGLAAVG